MRGISYMGVLLFATTAQAGLIKIAHRGASGYEPENTIKAFQKAVELGADMIELDVHVCKSGEVVVIHGYGIKSTNSIDKIVDKNFAELQQFDVGKGERIPTLGQVLDALDKRIKVNIELKGEGIAHEVAAILNTYIENKGWQPTDFLVSAFNHYLLRDFHKILPEVPIGVLCYGVPIGYAQCAQELGAYVIVTDYEHVNSDFVADAHKRGIQIFVYTANEPGEIQRLKDLGVDGIYSDFPDRL